jgi:chromate reductase
MIRLLGLSGSLRHASSNTAVLRTLQQRMPGGIALRLHPLSDLPLYNGDFDTEEPPVAVARLREAIQQADGLVLCTPEYNAGTSGVMKNALDWASRPPQTSPLRGKHALIISTSPAFTGGARAHVQLREALASTLSRVAVHPAVVIPQVFEKLKDGLLTDESSIRFALAAIQALTTEIRASRALTA